MEEVGAVPRPGLHLHCAESRGGVSPPPVSYLLAVHLDLSSTNHEGTDRQTDRAGAQRLRLLAISSRPPLADLPLCSQACIEPCGGNKDRGHQPSSYCRVPGLEGTSVVTYYLGHSALLSSKI